jgi:hypothetical protein
MRDCYALALREPAVTLRTAHKILISTAVVFFFGFGLWELRNYFETGNSWAVLNGLLYLSVAIGFGFYLGSLKRWSK